MDPFTFGIAFVGASSGMFILIHALEQSGISINHEVVTFQEIR
ncbi:hypothetical protein NST02_17725 [Robertmurraya sp. FSL W8-0741]